ncbi:hypothetical protein V8E54_007780 [Elaphomyces granulatus]
MANPFYDSITARCFHIWITITAKDCLLGLRPRLVTLGLWLLVFSQVESDNRLQIAIGLRPRFVTLGLWLLVFRKLNLTPVCKLQSDYGRGLSPSDYGFLLSQVESDNRLQIAIGLRPRFVTLGLWPLAFAIGVWQPFALAIGSRPSRNCDSNTGELLFTLYKPAKLQHYGFRKDGRDIWLFRLRISPRIKRILMQPDVNDCNPVALLSATKTPTSECSSESQLAGYLSLYTRHPHIGHLLAMPINYLEPIDYTICFREKNTQYASTSGTA